MAEFDEQLLLEYSDGELLSYISASPLADSTPLCRVVILSPNLVAKRISEDGSIDELAGIHLARRLGVRVPDIKRIVPNRDIFTVHVIMDRVLGTTLEDAWSRLGWFATIRIAFQLRRFVKAMRSVTSPTAGGIETGQCNSMWLDDGFGIPPKATPEAVNSFISFWLQYTYERRRIYPNLETYRLNRHLLPTLPASFVFTHQDLAPRNILLDKHNNISLVDWQFSGWYPIYFEYVGMQNFDRFSWSRTARFRWWVFSWISVGIYSRENRAMQLVRGWSLCDSNARCVVPGVQQWN
jgi:hypothetical protein